MISDDKYSALWIISNKNWARITTYPSPIKYSHEHTNSPRLTPSTPCGQGVAAPPTLWAALPGGQPQSGWLLSRYCGPPAPPALDPSAPPPPGSDPALHTGLAPQPQPLTLSLSRADRVLGWMKTLEDSQVGRSHCDYCCAETLLLHSETGRGAAAGCCWAAGRGCHSQERGGGSSSPEEAPPATGMMLRLGMTAQQKSPWNDQIQFIISIMLTQHNNRYTTKRGCRQAHAKLINHLNGKHWKILVLFFLFKFH